MSKYKCERAFTNKKNKYFYYGKIISEQEYGRMAGTDKSNFKLIKEKTNLENTYSISWHIEKSAREQ